MLLDEDEGVEENKLHEKKPWKYFCFALSKHIRAIRVVQKGKHSCRFSACCVSAA